MYALYNFHFLDTISKQLIEKINDLEISPLDHEALTGLVAFQHENRSRKGVYLLFHNGGPVYLGKADDVAARLQQHMNKLQGRLNLDVADIGFKCIILDESMSTAANEELLIRLFQRDHEGMWNNSGFGAKDPGSQRDNTKPGKFDEKYPINPGFVLSFPKKTDSVINLLWIAKKQLPYVFRFKVDLKKESLVVTLPVNKISVEDFLKRVLTILGREYQATILSYGIILYRENKTYDYGRVIKSD